MARAHSHTDRDDVESARRAAHHRGLFPARARGAREARQSRSRVGRLRSSRTPPQSRSRHARRARCGANSGTPSYEQKRVVLETIIPTDAVFSSDTSRAVPCGAVGLTPTMRVDSHADAVAFYQRLRAANRALRCDFFQGVVRKRAESPYPVQMRSATEEFRGWVRHRFLA